MKYSFIRVDRAIQWPSIARLLETVMESDGFSITREGDTVTIRREGHVEHVPWSRVTQATPIAEPIAPVMALAATKAVTQPATPKAKQRS